MAEPSATPGELRDFSHRLSPMLVKELRQGLRSKAFALSFILLQGGMIIFSLAAASDRSGGQGSSGVFWFILGCALLLVMPMRGSEALGSEINSGTMELLFLTRLSALRIAFGKWIAIFSQTCLLVVSILPFLILRYYLGGINVVQEIQILCLLLLASGVLTAGLIGFSGANHPLLRLLRIGVMVIGGFFLVVALGNMVMSFGSIFGTPSFSMWWVVLGAAVYATYFVYAFLDLGASRIAPLGTNHSTRKRLIGLLAIAVTFGLHFMGLPWGVGFTLVIIIALPLGIESLTEYPTLTRGILRPFTETSKVPVLGRLSAHLLAPGWHTGYFFYLLLVGLGALSLSLESSIDGDGWCAYFVGAAALAFPLLIIRLFFRNAPNSFLFYFVIQLAQFLVFLLLLWIWDDTSFRGSDWVFPFSGLFPLAGFFMGLNEESRWFEILGVAVVIFLLTTVVVLVTGIGLHTRMSRLFGLVSRKRKIETGEEEEESDESTATHLNS